MEKESKKWYLFLWNKYLIVSVAFVIWMLFFDENSYQIHRESDQQIKELVERRAAFKKGIEIEKRELEKIRNNPEESEKIAREKYYMRKSNEDVFIIEFAESENKEE